MSTHWQSRTRSTLLVRLKDPADQAAWGEFVTCYGPRIARWCRRYGLQASDVEEVTQQVLVKLFICMRSFAYDRSKSFRGWLHAVTRNAWLDWLNDRRRAGGAGSGDTAVLEQLHSLNARDDLLAELQEEFDYEVLAQAEAEVRLRVEPKTWEAFRLRAYEGLSAKEVAQRVGMKIAAVHVARSRVQTMLQARVRQLGQAESDVE